MNWRTELHIEQGKFQITHDELILSFGSCFAENIHKKFQYYGFGSLTNPTGILYNSRSILNMLLFLLDRKKLDDKRFVERDGMICHYDFHMDLRAKDKAGFLHILGQAQKEFQEQWEKAGALIVTLGTANVYKSEEEIVANCHKQDSKNFIKTLMPIDEIVSDIKQIKLLAEAKNILFTVSPVRHIKDGLVENQLSKAHLISAIHQINAPYFPSYEIVLDELRDYRFYASDLLHPSEEAIEYIWKKFSETYMSTDTHKSMKKIEKWRRLQNHKPFNAASEASIKNRIKIEEQFRVLKEEYPNLTFQ